MPYDRRRHPPRHPEKSTTVTTTAPGNQIALALIAQDIMFLRRFAHNITAAPDQAVIPIFCMHNYMCLIIHESNRALRHVDPDLADALAYDCAPAIERARHSVKLYDDKYKELDDVGADFRRIIEEHRQDSSTTPGCDWPGPLERDLALWRFRGRLVSTSHAASFFLAFPPQAFKNQDALGPRLHAENEVRAEKHYRRSFDPALREEIKASLTAMTVRRLPARAGTATTSPATARPRRPR